MFKNLQDLSFLKILRRYFLFTRAIAKLEVQKPNAFHVELVNKLNRAEDAIIIFQMIFGTEASSTMKVFDSSILTLDSTSKNTSLDLSFEEITYSVMKEEEQQNPFWCQDKVQRLILNQISGICKGGEVTAIMGSSGCGKTTLLNVLARRIGQNSGKVQANRTSYTKSDFTHFGNYSLQENHLMQTMTIRQTLEFASILAYSDEELRDRILQQVISNLKLYNCLDVYVGGPHIKGASGGEKKRVAIAVEIISGPQVLFLDQPTSGLDSLSSLMIVKYLQQSCQKKNQTVLMSIHQPGIEIMNHIDRLMLMTEGSIIYQGSPLRAISYFDQIGFHLPELTSPAEHFIAVMSPEGKNSATRTEFLIKKYEDKILPGVRTEIS